MKLYMRAVKPVVLLPLWRVRFQSPPFYHLWLIKFLLWNIWPPFGDVDDRIRAIAQGLGLQITSGPRMAASMSNGRI